jgi:hypothetical protein
MEPETWIPFTVSAVRLVVVSSTAFFAAAFAAAAAVLASFVNSA